MPEDNKHLLHIDAIIIASQPSSSGEMDSYHRGGWQRQSIDNLIKSLVSIVQVPLSNYPASDINKWGKPFLDYAKFKAFL